MGDSPVWVIVTRLEGASGADPATFSDVLHSDVETLVDRSSEGVPAAVPVVLPDAARRSCAWPSGIPPPRAGPSDNSSMTITRYRVTYRRADGRNVPGIDVPYAFDGAATRTDRREPPGARRPRTGAGAGETGAAVA